MTIRTDQKYLREKTYKADKMAYIEYIKLDQIKDRDRVGDDDHIIRIHGAISRVMKNHFDLYVTLMKRSSPISRKLREMIAVIVSFINHCRY